MIDPRASTRLAACAVLFAAALPAAAADPVDAGALRPGLVATYRDAAPAPREVVRLEPAVALALSAGEAPHPRLGADGGTVRWEGYLNVARAGDYRFRALVRGQVRLRVGGKEVVAAEVKDATPVLKEGPQVRLEPGWQTVVAEFTRLPGAARVEVFWESKGFRWEPLPYEVLRHLPAKAPARLATDAALDRGRFLVEERNCAACHRPGEKDRVAAGLAQRQGPDLSRAGERLYAGWVYRWLEAPDKVRPGAVMPRLFAADDAGRAERYAVAAYLAILGGPVQADKKDTDRAKGASRGERLFTSVGCIACHADKTKEDKAAPSSFLSHPASFPLGGLGGKTTVAKLTAYLQNPLGVDPSGRMPHLLLQGNEAQDIARYLCRDAEEIKLPDRPANEALVAAFERADDRKEELAAFLKLPADAQVIDLGKRVVIAKGCNNCHTIAPGGKPFASVLASTAFDGLKTEASQSRGCLANAPGADGRAPWFPLTVNERDSVRRFLSEGTAGAGSPAPAFAARAALQRFNCLACHVRDGEGGLSAEMGEELRKYEKAENAEAVLPPPLTGVGHKLRTPWMRAVLTEAKRARPWMGLRMPQFGSANVGKLPEALASLEGTEADDKVHLEPLTAAKVEAGRKLVGKSAFGCVACHDLAGNVGGGTRGPDLASMDQRVRYDWYRNWLEQPQRLSPGTRMPSVFTNGKSLVESVLEGSGDGQAAAIWAYLSLGPGLPLPEGIEPGGKGHDFTLTVKDRPVLLRTFMPDAGSRAVAVGYPGNVSVAFDAATCRLAYAWSGAFLDAAPVWDGRGGNPARLLGPQFWKAPPGCPVAVSASQEPPDFAARAKDPAYGAALPEGKLYDGPRQLAFEGYSVDKDGMPSFRYHLQAADPHPVEVTERPEPLRCGVGVGVARNLTVKAEPDQRAWLLAGESGHEPRLLDAKGAPVALDLKSEQADVPAAGRWVVLPQDGGKVIVLGASGAPDGTRWHLRKMGGKWEALLRLPAGSTSAKVQTWAPYRDEPALLKELVAAP